MYVGWWWGYHGDGSSTNRTPLSGKTSWRECLSGIEVWAMWLLEFPDLYSVIVSDSNSILHDEEDLID